MKTFCKKIDLNRHCNKCIWLEHKRLLHIKEYVFTCLPIQWQKLLRLQILLATQLLHVMNTRICKDAPNSHYLQYLEYALATGSRTLILRCTTCGKNSSFKMKRLLQFHGSVSGLLCVINSRRVCAFFFQMKHNGIDNWYMFVNCLHARYTLIRLNKTWETAQGCTSAVVCI